MAALTLSITEIIILFLGAIVLGVTIHFFLSSRRSWKTSGVESEKSLKSLEDWKLKYFNEIELKDRELTDLKQKFSEADEEKDINTIEIEEQRLQIKLLKSEVERLQKTVPHGEKQDYIEQLKQAQHNLKENQDIINHLLGQIDVIKETEETQNELVVTNEELLGKVSELNIQLHQKEKELNAALKKENMSKEMSSLLDNTYTEFNILQEKIQKLESNSGSSRILSLELADMKEANYKLQKDFDEQKLKLHGLTTENQNLQTQLAESEEKLRESNLQRLQVQKKAQYLEELNRDFQLIAEANKKLEVQIKQIGELESMLNVVSEERDDLARKQIKSE